MLSWFCLTNSYPATPEQKRDTKLTVKSGYKERQVEGERESLLGEREWMFSLTLIDGPITLQF